MILECGTESKQTGSVTQKYVARMVSSFPGDGGHQFPAQGADCVRLVVKARAQLKRAHHASDCCDSGVLIFFQGGTCQVHVFATNRTDIGCLQVVRPARVLEVVEYVSALRTSLLLGSTPVG